MSLTSLTLSVARHPIVALFTPDAAGVLRGVGNTRAAMFANPGGHWLVGLITVATVLLSLWIRRGRPPSRMTAPARPHHEADKRQVRIA